jgi:hypothetical protein
MLMCKILCWHLSDSVTSKIKQQQFTSLPMLKSCCLAGQVSNPFQQQIVPDPTGISYQKLGKIKTKSSTDVTKVFMENTDIKRAFKKIDNNNHRKFTSKHRRR